MARDNETRVTGLLLIEEREKAIKVRDKQAKDYWLPRSEITVSKDPIREGQQFREISVTMPDWLAEAKGF